ncbi:unnamed protein product [Linum trigynum]|uniref:Uncharacterized protein n=1 Tax=Linum trigynum TaxID=586398 RepID=A0AAV2GNE1_9ROSI
MTVRKGRSRAVEFAAIPPSLINIALSSVGHCFRICHCSLLLRNRGSSLLSQRVRSSIRSTAKSDCTAWYSASSQPPTQPSSSPLVPRDVTVSTDNSFPFSLQLRQQDCQDS